MAITPRTFSPKDGIKTLIVDDEAALRQLLEDVTRSRGHEVTACADAETAWEAYQREFYSLVILDLLLPGMDGFQLCCQMRSMPYGDRSVILVVTGLNQPEHLEAVLEAGADDYIAKPFELRRLEVRLTIAERQIYNRAERIWAMAQLVQASKLAAIGELAAGIAHEVLNPTNGMINCAEIIIAELEEGSQIHYFAKMIKSEGERITQIIRNLLTVSRQETEQYSTYRLCDIVSKSLVLLNWQLQKSNISLHIEVPEDLPALKCRSGHIQQVVMNLLLNALDALNKRYPGADSDKLLSVTAALTDYEGRPHLQLTVEDHGSGVSPDNLPYVFDPFFTTKELDQGTGLGLSISQEIVKNHGGSITVESQVGQFTRFHVNLPLDNQE